jgi:hypothetical protein
MMLYEIKQILFRDGMSNGRANAVGSGVGVRMRLIEGVNRVYGIRQS